MERSNIMSGILAFSFPCIIGASLTLPIGIKAEVLSKEDSLMYLNQGGDNRIQADSCALVFDSSCSTQLSTDK
jgi:hypothetical protein